MERERSVGGRRGLKAGQSGGGFGDVEVLDLGFGGKDFLGAIRAGVSLRTIDQLVFQRSEGLISRETCVLKIYKFVVSGGRPLSSKLVAWVNLGRYGTLEHRRVYQYWCSAWHLPKRAISRVDPL